MNHQSCTFKVVVRLRGERNWHPSRCMFWDLDLASEYAWRLYRDFHQIDAWQIQDEAGEVLATHGEQL